MSIKQAGIDNASGDRLVCARYRYDSKRMKRTTTVELVESEHDWVQNNKKKPRNKIVQIRIAYGEIHLGRLVTAAGGKWNRNNKVWELPYGKVLDLGLEQRITANELEKLSVFRQLQVR